MVQMVLVQVNDDRILFDETFIDKIGLFNINTLGSGGQVSQSKYWRNWT